MGDTTNFYYRLKFTTQYHAHVAERWIETSLEGCVRRAIDFFRNGDVGGVSCDARYRDVPLPEPVFCEPGIRSRPGAIEACAMSGQLFCDTWRAVIERRLPEA